MMTIYTRVHCTINRAHYMIYRVHYMIYRVHYMIYRVHYTINRVECWFVSRKLPKTPSMIQRYIEYPVGSCTGSVA